MTQPTNTAEIVDLAAWRDSRTPPPGAHCRLRPGQIVTRNGIVGRIRTHDSTAAGRDFFTVRWMDGTQTLASHVNLAQPGPDQIARFKEWEEMRQDSLLGVPAREPVGLSPTPLI